MSDHYTLMVEFWIAIILVVKVWMKRPFCVCCCILCGDPSGLKRLLIMLTNGWYRKR